MRLLEANEVHIYQDDNTGNYYYFDGSKLIYLGKKNQNIEIGSHGNKDLDEFEKEHDAKLAKEREEHPEWYENEKGDKADSEDEIGMHDDESEEAREARLKRIKDMLVSDEVAGEIKRETDDHVYKELKRIKAQKEREAKKYTSDIQRFKESLKKFIGNQIKKIKQPTYKVANQKYSGTGIVKPGKQRKDNKVIPVINVYFDQSGSWGPNDIRVGEEAIGVLNNYVKRGEIIIKIFYFGNVISDTPDNVGGGTGAGEELIRHIQATKPTNVIVMTDDDFDSWDEITRAPYIRVPGAVWFLFRGGESIRLQEHLKGKAQTKKFFI